jgi:hypothetical protein
MRLVRGGCLGLFLVSWQVPASGRTRYVEAAVCGIPGVSRLSDMRVSGHALQDKLLGRFFRGN